MINLAKQQYRTCKAFMQTGMDTLALASSLKVSVSTVRMQLNHAREKASRHTGKPVTNLVQLALVLVKEGFTDGTNTTEPFSL